MEIQKSKRARTIKFIIGGIAIGFSGYRFLNVANASSVAITYPGLAVLVIGIVNILKGILSKGDSKLTRTIETSIGIIAILFGLFLKVYIDDTSTQLTLFISLFLIIQSVGFIATGITQRGKSKVTRIPKIILGASIIAILTGLLLEYQNLSITMINILLSINLFTMGMDFIMDAISQKTVRKS
jgi:uncharacterized membrane protein HdeD (DUF308 family)